MKKFAVIIKHEYRDFDYRVDVYDVPDDMDSLQLKTYAESKLLGNFQIVSVTDRVTTDVLSDSPLAP